jgi:dethiobiotin synthase
MRGVFVTGTDTGVGKTVLCAALLRRYAAARYWKPVETGIEVDNDTAEVVRLSGASVREEGVRLRGAVSPHLAATRAGVRIEIDPLIEWTLAASDENPWVVEGAGGVLVPLNESQTMAHLMLRLGLPIVLAARSTLGTINHTLLSLEALRARSLHVTGVVMIGEPNPDNRAAIEHYGKTTVLGEMPNLDPLTPSALKAWATTGLDPDGRLAEFLA